MHLKTTWATACCLAILSAQVLAQDSNAGRRIDVRLLAVPTTYHVFMRGRTDEKIIEARTSGCRTEIKTNGGLVDSIDWTDPAATPDRGHAQLVGTRNSGGTLADFSASIPGQSIYEQTMGEQYKKEFDALYSDMTALWKSCVVKK
ncbi:hypothetical protein ACOYW6_13335 [Parablastomonas sp. CN1-191]|uniref:hypothetical protein n=1 Tax=Parablastomonas sp. CN1-191 TaxID=3400908 RepID=UPI003BF79E63